MEQFFPGAVTPQDFLEVYTLLSKCGLLENIATICEVDLLEQFTQELATYIEDSKETSIKEQIQLQQPHETQHYNRRSPNASSMLEFMDLKDVYEKVQSRAGGGSHQRVASGIIIIKATSEEQLCGLNVYVQRTPEAATLCGDFNGRTALQVNHEDYYKNQQIFSVDLDSVYGTVSGTPVYKLATVDAERRNLFQLVAVLKFIDGSESEHFMSKPFLIRSRKPGSRSNSFECS